MKPPRFLTRLTSGAALIPEIEGLRFIAIASVVFFHLRCYVGEKTPVPFSTPVSEDGFARFLMLGDVGVQLFFVISGFVLALPFASYHFGAGPKIDIKRYLLRRVTRLEPPYVASLLLFFVALTLTKHESFGTRVPSLLASLFYSHGFIFGQASAINVVCWSLEVEIQFYLLMPLLAYAFAIRGAFARRAVLVLAATVLPLVIRMVDPSGGASPFLWISLLGQFQFFIVGMLLADCYLSGLRSATSSVLGDVLSAIGFVALGFLWSSAHGLPKEMGLARVLITLSMPLTIFAAYYGALRSVYVRRFLTLPWIGAIGGMCYTIYLLHYPVISFVGRITVRWGFPGSFFANYLLQVLLVLPPLAVLSAGFFALIERPCMARDWPQRLWSYLARLVSPPGETPPA